MMKSIFFYQTAIGKVMIAEKENYITNLSFHDEKIPPDAIIKETGLLKEANEQLKNYLLGKRKEFLLPLAPTGTEFMLSVWEALRHIPYGETRNYKDIALSISNPKAARAVGRANNKNPIPIFIPCHRVIGANGKLVGYLGGLQIKEHLLQLEKNRAVSK